MGFHKSTVVARGANTQLDGMQAYILGDTVFIYKVFEALKMAVVNTNITISQNWVT